MSTMSNLKVPFQFSTNFPTSCQPQTGKVIISLKECLTINNIKRISADVTKCASAFWKSSIWTFQYRYFVFCPNGGSPIGVSPIGGSPNGGGPIGGSPSPIGVSPNGGSPIGGSPNGGGP